MNQLITGKEGRQKIADGVNKLANAVKITLGAKGKNVIINRGSNVMPHITKDGVTVINSINLTDEIEQMGAVLLKGVANRVVYEAGDSTTATCVLSQALINNGNAALDEGFSPKDINEGIELAYQETLSKIKEHSIQLTTNDQIRQIATISANNDAEIGGKIAEAYDKIGHDGVVIVEEGNTEETKIELLEGMKLNRGFISDYFVNARNFQCVLDNPYVLITDIRITEFKAIAPILDTIHRENLSNPERKRSLLIIAEDVEGNALSTLILNITRGTLPMQVCAIRTPEVGKLRNSILGDIAKRTGGTVVSKDVGRDMSKQVDFTTLKGFGQAKSIKISKNDCTIIEGAANEKELAEHVLSLRTLYTESESGIDKENLKKRIQSIENKIAVIKIGSSGELELKEKKDRVDDAVCATKAAIEEGIVAGGGSMFLNISNEISEEVFRKGVERGKTLFANAITHPFVQILKNSEVELHQQKKISDEILEKGYGYGYNVLSEKVENLVETGVIDPAKVLRVALTQAVSMAKTFLTTEVVVSEIHNQNGGN